MTSKLKILIVEDEPAVRSGLGDLFVYHGYEVSLAVDGKQGLHMALNDAPDLVVLDIMLPELDGFSVCDEIRKVNRDLPIILLTAKSSDEDIVAGLRLGADDYVTKPFSVEELLLRVKAVLRRSSDRGAEIAELAVGAGLVIDVRNLKGANKITGEEIEFTRRELDILLYLAAHAQRPVPRDELLEQVWGYENASRIETRTVDIHIAKLRRKVEIDPRDPDIIVTVRGEGYRLIGAKANGS